jgi:hemolysin activation/secretion protein
LTGCYYYRLKAAIGTLLCALSAGTAQAAPPPTFQQQRPAEEPLELPAYEPETRPAPLQLPPLPTPQPDAGLSRQLRVYVTGFTLEGNRVFSDAELSAITAEYTNRDISSAELQELRYRLTLYYVERGYINSGAIIPDQRVTEGVITLQIIEGELSEIAVSGTGRLRTDYLSRRVALGGGPPLNITVLGEHLQILQQNPRIQQLNATLVPGSRPGESRLNVLVREAQPHQLWFDAGNPESPSVGGESAALRGSHLNLSGHGDTFDFRLAGGEGLREWEAGYRMPLNARDTELGLHWHGVDSEVVEPPFDALDIESNESTLGLSLTHPLRPSVNETIALGLTLDLRRSETFLLGAPFPFVTGTDNGESRLSVLRLSQEWLQRGRSQVLAARSLLSAGIDAFNATVNGEPGDGEFFAWLGQFQWARRLAASDMQVIFRADAQVANGMLPSMEQFTVGGAASVRGYRENRLIADTGFVTSLEARIPLYNSESGHFRLQAAPFVDYGYARNRSGSEPGRDIVSAGIGLRGSLHDRLVFQLYYGHAFEDFADEEPDLQDNGFHFLLSARLL